jgi:hypothetical protein
MQAYSEVMEQAQSGGGRYIPHVADSKYLRSLFRTHYQGPIEKALSSPCLRVP